jgi:hypothetical protein
VNEIFKISQTSSESRRHSENHVGFTDINLVLQEKGNLGYEGQAMWLGYRKGILQFMEKLLENDHLKAEEGMGG